MIEDANVSIIVPVYNDAKSLAGCLEALINQSYSHENTEIIVVDNGSTDQSIAVAKSFSRVKVIEESHPGSYAARNKGIASATHSVLAFLDADSIAHPDWLYHGISALEQIGYDGLVGGRIEFSFREQAKPTLLELYDSITYLDNEKNIEECHFAVTACMFTTKNVFDQVGFFDSTMKSGGDREWGERVHKANKASRFSGEALIFHHARNSITELIRKTRRVTGGIKSIENMAGGKKINFISSLIPPVSRMRNVMVNKMYGSVDRRLCLAGLVYFFKMVGAFELLRLTLGYSEQRK